MFFSIPILIRNGGEFTIIWQLAHGKATKAIQNEVAQLNITAKCEELIKYLPTGQLTATEVRNKMSLYLLGVLQYGIVVAFARKTDIVLQDLTTAIKLFKTTIPKTPAKRKSTDAGKTTTKKTRRSKAATLAPITEEEEGEEQLIDLRNLPVEEISDRYRVGDMRQITLDEYDQQQPSFFEPDLRNFEDMMMLELEERSETSREAGDIPPPNRLDDTRMAEMQNLFAELVDGLDLEMVALDPLVQRHNLSMAIDAEAPTPQMQAEIEEQHPLPPPIEPTLETTDVFGADQHMEVELQEPEPPQVEPMEVDPSFQLPELNETQIREEIAEESTVQPQRARRRRVRNLIVDQRTEFTDADIRRNMENTDDICLDRRLPPLVQKLPTVAELFAPYPIYMPKFAAEQLGPFFKGAAEAALENLRQRQEATAREEEPEIARQPSPARSVGRPSTVPEAARRDTSPIHFDEPVVPEAELTYQQDAVPPPSPARFEEPPLPEHQFTAPEIIPSPPRFEEPPMADAEVARHETIPSPARSVGRQTIMPEDVPRDFDFYESPTEADASLASILGRIKAVQTDEAPVEFLKFANKSSKAAVSRDFIDLLYLLKHRKVTAEQQETYGPIMVQVVGNGN